MGLTADFPLWVGAGLPLEVIVQGHVIVQAGLPQRTYKSRSGSITLEWVRQPVFLRRSEDIYCKR